MKKGFVYILKCSDCSFYTGSTIDMEQRLNQHQMGRGSNHTRNRLPVTLVYLEVCTTIGAAFEREKQIQGWRREKKLALINKNYELLPKLAECKNSTHFKEWLRLRSATINSKENNT
ncbi:hypothetical protein KH5_14940 [Urechidicola sp. KH5]